MSDEAQQTDAGPWVHLDGSTCPHYYASRPLPDETHYWWCTEHQQHVRTTRPKVWTRRDGFVEWWKQLSWRIEGWLLAWTFDAEPTDHADASLLAEDDNGGCLMPHRFEDGEPYWMGRWRWWRPDHWPVYVRSRRARTYVMVERWQ